MGDTRRQSFIQNSSERAMFSYGITHLSVFLGGNLLSLLLLFVLFFILPSDLHTRDSLLFSYSSLLLLFFVLLILSSLSSLSSSSSYLIDWALKKFGKDSFFKKRFIWIDISDNTFHWCKVQDRSGPHKRIKFIDVVGLRTGPPEISSFLEGYHQPELCWSIDFVGGKSIDIKMTDVNKVNDWIKVIQIILNNYNHHTTSVNNQEIQPIDIITS